MTREEKMLQQTVSDAIERFGKADRLRGLEACRQVVAVADLQTRYYVGCAREDGASWEKIGTALGISRQAVQQRFGEA